MPAPSKSSRADAPTPEQLAEQLRGVIGNLVRKVRGEAQTPSSAQAETLGFIDRSGPASIAALAAFRHVKHQSMRLVIEQMEAQGLLCRGPDPHDGRKQLIALTDEGRAALAQQRQQRSQWLAEQLEQKTTPAELATLRDAVNILERLIADDEPQQSR